MNDIMRKKGLPARERTSFVADLQTKNGCILSWKAESSTSFTFEHTIQTFDMLYTALFFIVPAVNRPF